MKIIAFFCISFILLLLSCNDSTESSNGYIQSDAKIIGYDYRKCMCCGGWFVDINNDTLRIWNMPEEFQKILNEKQPPVNVRLSWKKMTDGCGASMKDIILVNSISLK